MHYAFGEQTYFLSSPSAFCVTRFLGVLHLLLSLISLKRYSVHVKSDKHICFNASFISYRSYISKCFSNSCQLGRQCLLIDWLRVFNITCRPMWRVGLRWVNGVTYWAHQTHNCSRRSSQSVKPLLRKRGRKALEVKMDRRGHTTIRDAASQLIKAAGWKCVDRWARQNMDTRHTALSFW